MMKYKCLDTDTEYETEEDLFSKDTAKPLEIIEDNDGVDEVSHTQIIRRIPCCPNCSKSIWNWSNFCHYCGQRLKH